MKNPNLNTRVVHSQSKSAWNIIGCNTGFKYKIARIPYYVTENEQTTEINRLEAYEHAEFINYAFNNAQKVIK